MSYISLNGRVFDADVAIEKYSQNFNVLDGPNTGRSIGDGVMIRDIIGTYLGHKMTLFRRGNNYQGFDDLWDYLVEHSVDKDGVLLEAADGQTTISYMAYYTSGQRDLESVCNGVNYWGTIEINFVPMKAQVTPT